MRALIIVHPTPKDIRGIITLKDDDYIIAVDQSVLSLYKQRIKIDLAVGDFDSLKNLGCFKSIECYKIKARKKMLLIPIKPLLKPRS